MRNDFCCHLWHYGRLELSQPMMLLGIPFVFIGGYLAITRARMGLIISCFYGVYQPIRCLNRVSRRTFRRETCMYRLLLMVAIARWPLVGEAPRGWLTSITIHNGFLRRCIGWGTLRS